ncbi:MAG: hypothetical protein INR71_05115, partial [Terriglobus roseus]|nr:hypothetical protein [Terriglobus roseus]
MQPWMIDVVSHSLPFLADKPTIKKTLEDCKGNIDMAVSRLLDAEEGGSMSSAQESSSIEREPDSDDDAVHGPNKRQDRRMSKATRNLVKGRDHYRRDTFAKIEHRDGSQESVASSGGSQAWEDVTDTASVQSRSRTVKAEEDDDSDYKPDADASAVVDDEDDDGSAGPTQKFPSRIKLNLSSPPSSQTSSTGRSYVRQVGPQGRIARPTARQ